MSRRHVGRNQRRRGGRQRVRGDAAEARGQRERLARFSGGVDPLPADAGGGRGGGALRDQLSAARRIETRRRLQIAALGDGPAEEVKHRGPPEEQLREQR